METALALDIHRLALRVLNSGWTQTGCRMEPQHQILT